MIPKPLNEIAEADIQQLKASGVEEGKTIEYKRDLPGTKDEDKREFLADVSSFANTEGGDIIYGVAEDLGVIAEIVGLASSDIDAEVLRMESLVRDGIAPRIGIMIVSVPSSAGKLVVLRVEKSWNRPHRVIFRGHDKFYARTSAGKFALDVAQLRTAFLQSATISEQIAAFRMDRLVDIAGNRTPIPLPAKPKLALHIIPLGAFADESQYDVSVLYSNTLQHRLWGSYDQSSKMTFNGVLLHSTVNSGGTARTYAHFYRNGIFEAVSTSLLEADNGQQRRVIPPVKFEGAVLDYLPKCLATLAHLGVHPPVSLSLTLIGVKGLSMALSDPYGPDSGNPIQEDNLIIPGVILNDFAADVEPILQPMFDRVWNACGLLRSENFGDDGVWIRTGGY